MTQTYGYDDQGRRVRKTIGAVPILYVYNGTDIHAQYDATWAPTATATAAYTHGPGMDHPILRKTTTESQFYHSDGLGSVVASSSPTGTITASARYDAWGRTVSATNVLPTFGYTGREPDETGLIYYRARYYDPATGRFTQQDPLGFRGGAINFYSYVVNNPVNRVDPSGLEIFFAPGTDVSGKRNEAWWKPGSRFATKASEALNDPIQLPLGWSGGSTGEARSKAAQDFAQKINAVPPDRPVYLFLHSHSGNVFAEAQQYITRDINVVVTMGTPVRPDYTIDTSKVGKVVAISSQTDIVQGAGGGGFWLPFLGEFGPAERERPGASNVLLESGSHSVYYQNADQTMNVLCGVYACAGRAPSVTIGPTGSPLNGSAQAPPEGEEGASWYSVGGQTVKLTK